jgi:hypothetical protein
MSEASTMLRSDVESSAYRCLRRSQDGHVWYVLVAPDEAWVAVTDVGDGGGGGWFRSDLSLDPASSDWTPVGGTEVLAGLRTGREQAARLTARMVASCITDGLGIAGLKLADALLDHGYTITVTVDG